MRTHTLPLATGTPGFGVSRTERLVCVVEIQVHARVSIKRNATPISQPVWLGVGIEDPSGVVEIQVHSWGTLEKTLIYIFLCLPRAERNQRFLFVKNESIKFCCSGGFSNVPDVMEASVLFISTVFHVRSVSCRCLYLGFRAPCAARVTRVTCSKRSLLGVPLELE